MIKNQRIKLCKELSEHRKKTGYTLKKVSELSNKSIALLSRFENGDVNNLDLFLIYVFKLGYKMR